MIYWVLYVLRYHANDSENMCEFHSSDENQTELANKALESNRFTQYSLNSLQANNDIYDIFQAKHFYLYLAQESRVDFL